ncbi:MAG: hypothetical protein ACTTH7_07310, partial [Treponema sp.]
MNMKFGSRIIAGLSIAALLMTAACKQSNTPGGISPDQKAVEAEGALLKGTKLTALQSGIMGASVTDAKTAVPLAEGTTLTLPALPQVTKDSGIKAEWVSSNSAVTLPTVNGGVGIAKITHPEAGKQAQEVVISVKYSKNGKFCLVPVAKFSVQPKAAGNTKQALNLDVTKVKVKGVAVNAQKKVTVAAANFDSLAKADVTFDANAVTGFKAGDDEASVFDITVAPVSSNANEKTITIALKTGAAGADKYTMENVVITATKGTVPPPPAGGKTALNLDVTKVKVKGVAVNA